MSGTPFVARRPIAGQQVHVPANREGDVVHAPAPGVISAGVVTTLAFFLLIGFVVHTLRTAAGARLAGVLTAIATLMAMLPAVLYALYGT